VVVVAHLAVVAEAAEHAVAVAEEAEHAVVEVDRVAAEEDRAVAEEATDRALRHRRVPHVSGSPASLLAGVSLSLLKRAIAQQEFGRTRRKMWRNCILR